MINMETTPLNFSNNNQIIVSLKMEKISSDLTKPGTNMKKIKQLP
jgi:hypothetical protein